MTEGLTAEPVCSATHTRISDRSAKFQHDGRSVVSPDLAAHPGVVHASTTRSFQATLPHETSRLQEMHAVCQMLGISACPLYSGEQKHTNNVAVIKPDSALSSGENYHCFPQTDALVTAAPGVALAIQTADCAPIFLYDPTAQVIGLAHAGWKGTLTRIAEATVRAMTTEGANPADIIAWIGPMACVCCYEVSPEMIESFAAEFSDMPAQLVHRNRHLDLVSINASQLESAGLSPAQIHSSGICTIHQRDRFFSYRADNGTRGRILSILAMQRP